MDGWMVRDEMSVVRIDRRDVLRCGGVLSGLRGWGV